MIRKNPPISTSSLLTPPEFLSNTRNSSFAKNLTRTLSVYSWLMDIWHEEGRPAVQRIGRTSARGLHKVIDGLLEIIGKENPKKEHRQRTAGALLLIFVMASRYSIHCCIGQ